MKWIHFPFSKSVARILGNLSALLVAEQLPDWNDSFELEDIISLMH